MNAYRQERRQVLLDQKHHFCSDVHATLRELAAQHFKPRPRARKPRPEFRISVDVFQAFVSERRHEDAYTTHPRAVLEVFVDEALQFLASEFARAYNLDETHFDSAAFDQEIAPLPDDNTVTPKFHCHDLVDTTCEETCGWQTAFWSAAYFSGRGSGECKHATCVCASSR